MRTLGRKKNECLPYVKNDVLSTAFCYATYTMAIKEITVFGTKNSLTLPSLANKYFYSLGDENDKDIYSYNDPFMRNFVRQSIKGGRCSALYQYYKSTIIDEIFNIISKEVDSNANICDILDIYFEYTNEQRKIIEDEYDSQFEDYRDINQEERTKYINDKLSKLSIMFSWSQGWTEKRIWNTHWGSYQEACENNMSWIKWLYVK